MKNFINKRLSTLQAREIQGERSGYCKGDASTPYDKKTFGGGYAFFSPCSFFNDVCASPVNTPDGMKLVAVRWRESLYTLDALALVDCFYAKDEFPCTGSLIWC
ncbi:hypothetical protein AB9P05_00870 [Roseivirga sp. BDSF3-8]|uniref:hypothetical protein n=1 Tax=Roseivirga sp. BDSF3-8 TaxID=3241598 RepID=UPI003531DAA2